MQERRIHNLQSSTHLKRHTGHRRFQWHACNPSTGPHRRVLGKDRQIRRQRLGLTAALALITGWSPMKGTDDMDLFVFSSSGPKPSKHSNGSDGKSDGNTRWDEERGRWMGVPPPPPETTAELTAGQTDRAVSSVGVVEENVGVELWFRNATLANQTYDASFS